MNIIFLMIPLSFLILVFAIVGFFWAVNHSQFDDLDKQGHTPLEDSLENTTTNKTDKNI